MNDGNTVLAPSLVRIDLGAGQNKKEGFTGMDRWEGSNIVHDLLDLPWPFEDGSVDELHCSHVMEHFVGEDQMKIMDEAFRVLKFSEADASSTIGTLTVIVPSWNSVRMWQDPTHKSPFPDARAHYFNKEWRTLNKLDHYPIKSDFDFTAFYQMIDPGNGIPGFITRSREAQLFAMHYYNNVIADTTIVFRKARRKA